MIFKFDSLTFETLVRTYNIFPEKRGNYELNPNRTFVVVIQ